MSDETASAQSVDAVIADYLQEAEAGRVPSRQELLERFPQYASDLTQFFADYDRMDNRAGAFKLPTTRPEAQRPTVKYIGDYELLEEAAAGLDHPNIVPLYEVGEHERQHYLAMKFIDGPSLARLPRGSVKEEVVRLEAVARAVDFAHRQGILHRDIKPSNILVDTSGTPYVTDFGLAKRLDAELSMTETGQAVGTAGYWSPEQALGKKGLTVTTDVFSLGALLYERLTGKMAFPGATHLERLRSLDNDPSRPTYLVPTLPRDLETVCLKCLEREPGKRYPTAADMADDLARWLRGEPITARRASQMERFWLWCRRNRAISISSAAALLFLLSGATVSVVFGVTAHRAEVVANAALRDTQLAIKEKQLAIDERNDAIKVSERMIAYLVKNSRFGNKHPSVLMAEFKYYRENHDLDMNLVERYIKFVQKGVGETDVRIRVNDTTEP